MDEQSGASRRDLLKGGALGMGALGAFGMSSTLAADPAAAATPAATAANSVQIFLKLSGVAGESTDPKHRGEIDVSSFSWGETNAAPVGGGGGSGRAQASDLAITALTSKASPVLFLNGVSGRHMASALLTVRKGGRTPLEYIKITLADVLVTSYKEGDGGGGLSMDAFTLSYSRLQFAYYPAGGAPVITSWDFRVVG